MKLFTLVFTLFFSSLVSAEIYEIIDENGHKIYTDKPPLDKPDAKPVSVSPHTGNSWQQDAVQQQNDRYYDELKQKNQALSDIQTQKIAEKNAQKEKLATAVTVAEENLEKAKEIKAGDFLPHQNQGMRYSQQYLDRVKKAEEALQKAKEATAQ